MSEILHCSFMLEHKQGHMVATSARLQFCFVNTVSLRKFPVVLAGHSIHVSFGIHLQVHYCVLVVDQVLGTMEVVPNTLSGTDHLTHLLQHKIFSRADHLVEDVAAKEKKEWAEVIQAVLLADSGTHDSLVHQSLAVQFQEQGQATAAEDHPSWNDLCNTLLPFSPPFSPPLTVLGSSGLEIQLKD
jgi:hypothetical protein